MRWTVVDEMNEMDCGGWLVRLAGIGQGVSQKGKKFCVLRELRIKMGGTMNPSVGSVWIRGQNP